jgi:hypothetical protein
MHRRVIVVAGLLVMTALTGLDAAEEAKTIKDVMANHKPGQARAKITAALKEANVDWDAVQAQTKAYAAHAEALPKFKPPKGDEEAFKKIATTFATAVKDLDKAAQAKDAKAATAALGKSALCMNCHKDHR